MSECDAAVSHSRFGRMLVEHALVRREHCMCAGFRGREVLRLVASIPPDLVLGRTDNAPSGGAGIGTTTSTQRRLAVAVHSLFVLRDATIDAAQFGKILCN